MGWLRIRTVLNICIGFLVVTFLFRVLSEFQIRKTSVTTEGCMSKYIQVLNDSTDDNQRDSDGNNVNVVYRTENGTYDTMSYKPKQKGETQEQYMRNVNKMNVKNVTSYFSLHHQNQNVKSVTAEHIFIERELRERAKNDVDFLVRILNQEYLHPDTKEILKCYFTGCNYSSNFEYNKVFKKQLKQHFDINFDVMVFLHIQKTGGTELNYWFKSQLDIPFQCQCPLNVNPCACLNPKGNAWIYTSIFNGWTCGLHADWTQLHRCIPGQIDTIEEKKRKIRYFYFTQLRDPIIRYLSEFHHQSVKGNHWQDAILGCGPGFSDWVDIRPCFHAESWKDVSLDDFMACPHNLATNRMTRMLADLNKANCYRDYLNRNYMLKRANIWLESAKENLQQMEYFGLMEETEASDRLFSSVYNIHMRADRHNSAAAHGSKIRLTEEQFLKLLQLVELDIHLYLFAKQLFQNRIKDL